MGVICLILMATLAFCEFETVAIIASNDIHGSAFPTELFRSDNNQTYNYGGLQFMAQMIETIKEQYKGNVLYLDAGDQFQGGIQSSSLVSNGEIMNDFFKTLNVDASAIGNHEFDFGPDFLFPFLQGRKSPNLAANLRSETGEKDFLPHQRGTFTYELSSGIKIGVIGLSTLETPSTTSGFNDGSFPRYQFLNYAPIVIEKSKSLRKKGAHAVVLLSHVGNRCDANSTFGMWYQQTEQLSQCLEDDEISMLIKAIPSGTVDGIVQGHRHVFSHHFIKGIPVMGTTNGGYYFNVMYLKFYNFKIYEKVIEGPIPVCQKIFTSLKTCGYVSQANISTAGELVHWSFHGKTVKKHKKVKNLFTKKWLPLMSSYLEPLVKNQVYMQKDKNKQNDLGNLITNLMKAAVPSADFAILNAGIFRSVWIPGVIQYQHLYNMFPFLQQLNSFEMTGLELIKTIQLIQAGKKAFYQTYGLSQNITISKKTKRIKQINVRCFNNSQILPNSNYRIVSIPFLTEGIGGDDFQNVMGKIYTLRNEIRHGDFKELIKPQLMKLGTIRENTLIDPLHPRLRIVYE